MLTLREGSVATAEIEVKRSRFIATVARAETEENARQMISGVRAAFPDARHHCSAYVIRPEGLGPRMHSSDDGEPAGTAGNPMLEVLQHSGLENVVAVVTRYFGGTLLGTGGLVRAYSGAVQEALAAAPLVTIETSLRFAASVPLESAGKVESSLRNAGWQILATTWGAELLIEIAARDEDEAELASAISSLTRTPPSIQQVGVIRTEVDSPGHSA